MKLEHAINYDDLRRMARRRLPKIAFDFIEGGTEGEHGLPRNTDAFQRHALVPRYMVDISERSQSTSLFGRTYASPFGIAPTGAAGLFRSDADLMLAEAARAADIPFIISGAASATIEDIARVAPEHAWFQLYPPNNDDLATDQIARAAAAGLSTLVVTVDVPNLPKRERNLRNGFSRPLKTSLYCKVEALAHPGWLAMHYARGGQPPLGHYVKYAGPGATAEQTLDLWSRNVPGPVSWERIERWRRLWPRKFVLKGIMHPDDAVRAAAIGVDGVMVSNHGGRQLDSSPAPLDVLPAIRDAAGDKLTVMFDSGIRRGSDALIALCLGAEFVFVGRWTLYAVAAAGRPGAHYAVRMIRNEIDGTMAQMGAPDIKSLGPQWLMWRDAADRQRNQRP